MASKKGFIILNTLTNLVLFRTIKINYIEYTKNINIIYAIILLSENHIAHNPNNKFIFYIIENLNKIYTKIKRYY